MLPPSDQQVCLDVGLKAFAYLSDGSHIDNPRFFRQEEKALTKVQRKLSKVAKGIPERAKRRKVVARLHERIRWRREHPLTALSWPARGLSSRQSKFADTPPPGRSASSSQADSQRAHEPIRGGAGGFCDYL